MMTMNNINQHCSKNLQRNVVRSLPFAAAFLVGRPLGAKAGLFTSEQQDALDEIAKAQRPVNEVIDQLKPANVPNPIGVYSTTTQLKGGVEDSNVVRGYMEVYVKPLQKNMEKLAPKLTKITDSAAVERLGLLPKLMLGHILELTQAIDSKVAADQLKELVEVQETLAEFLKIASEKYDVQPYTPIRPLTDAELFGPLGCEFWGKKRVEGSNACAPKE